MEKKYKKVNRQVIDHPMGDGKIVVWNVLALVDIPIINVLAGDIGGFIDRSSILDQAGSAWIGGKSYALDNSSVLSDARLEGNAIISGTIVKEGSIVMDNARINTIPGIDRKTVIDSFSLVSGNARLSNVYMQGSSFVGEAAVVHNSTLRQTSKVSGFAKIENSTLTNSEVYGAAILKSGVALVDSKVHCSAVLQAKTYVDGSEVYGDANIDYAYKGRYTGTFKHSFAVPVQCTMSGHKIDDCHDIYTVAGYSKKIVTRVSGEKLGQLFVIRQELAAKKVKAETLVHTMDTSQFDEIAEAYAAYETDIVKVIKYPAMCDMTDPFTAKFNSLLRTVHRAINDVNADMYQENIALLENAYYAAESNARKIANSMFDDEAKTKISDAKQMLAITMDKAASDTEKKNALRGALRNLEGRIAVPEAALIGLRAMAGLKEIEA